MGPLDHTRRMSWPVSSPVRTMGPTNPALTEDMETLATSFAKSDSRLDFSMQSLSVLDEELATGPAGAERQAALAAYLGEVIRRTDSENVVWQWPPPRSPYPELPHLEVANRTYACPASRVGPDWKSGPDDTLETYAAQILAYASNPNEDTAGRLHLKSVYEFPTAWRGLQDRWIKRRRQASHIPR